jgi:hypothetical protein
MSSSTSPLASLSSRTAASTSEIRSSDDKDDRGGVDSSEDRDDRGGVDCLEDRLQIEGLRVPGSSSRCTYGEICPSQFIIIAGRSKSVTSICFGCFRPYLNTEPIRDSGFRFQREDAGDASSDAGGDGASSSLSLRSVSKSYGSDAIKGIYNNGMNVLSIKAGTSIANKLLERVAEHGQSSTSLASWDRFPVPTFQHVEVTEKTVVERNLDDDNYAHGRQQKTRTERGLQASNGKSIFFFQGKLFILERSNHKINDGLA